MPHSANFRASLFMLLAMGLFTIGDSITKYLSEEMNSGQYMLVRGIFATAAIGFFALRHGALRKVPLLEKMTLLRVLGEVVATVTYIYVLSRLSQAFCSAVFQSTPILVTLCAALFLGEKVGWRRWTSILVGLMGVLIIIRPGENPNADFASLGVLLASIAFTVLRDLATRRVPAHVPSLYISVLTAAAIAITGGVLVEPMGGWQPMCLGAVVAMATAAVLLVIGNQCIILAMREGEVSFVVPFRYSSLLWAICTSMIVFGQAPDHYTLAGSVLVVGSGVYMIYRENRQKRKQARLLAAAKPL